MATNNYMGAPQPINTSPYNAGSRSPRPPNNGNPRGANNMPRQQPEYLPPVPFDPTRRQQPAGGGYSTRPPMPRKDPYSPNEIVPDGQTMVKPGNSFVSTNPLMGGQPPMPQKAPMENGMPGGQNGSGNFQQMLQQLMERFRSQGVGGRNFNTGFQPQGAMGERYPQPQYPPRGDGNYYAQQSPDRGRYVPPMMNRDGQGWQGQGGYNYNLPNAFGSYPGYGQGDPNSQYFGYGYNGMYGGG